MRFKLVGSYQNLLDPHPNHRLKLFDGMGTRWTGFLGGVGAPDLDVGLQGEENVRQEALVNIRPSETVVVRMSDRRRW